MEKNFSLRTADGSEYTISGLAYIGRDADCLIRYDDPAISRHHARVWVAQGGLWLADDNSANGLFLNDWQIVPAQVYQLQSGDRLRLGETEIELEVVEQTVQVAVLTASPARRLTPIVFVGIFGCLLVFGLGTLASAFFLFRGNISGRTTASEVKIVAISTPQPLLKPQEYASSSQALVQAVAQLNQSELAFLQAANGTVGYLPKVSLARLALPIHVIDALDENLRQVAADAMRVATLADSLNKAAAAQGGGSVHAGQMAAQYGSVAQLGAALVITAQDLRQGLARGDLTKQNAAASIAEYGARLWNPEVSDSATPGNPFRKYLSDPSVIPLSQPLSTNATTQLTGQIGSPSVWVAASGEKVTKKLSLPNPGQAAVNANDPVTLAKMSTAEGQTDGEAAQQIAAAMLQVGGGTVFTNDSPGEGEVVAAFWSAVTVSSPDQPGTTPSRNLPAFSNGSVIVISQPSSNDIISNLITLDNANNPTITAQIPVEETKPLVSLEISNLSLKQINKRPKDAFNTFEADVVYEFDVKWATNLATPQFTLDCVSGNHFEISTPTGSQHINAKGLLILYPGAEDAFCYASRNGNTWGSASVHFLVGDPSEATQRAVQVETDSVSLDLTLTADAHGTLAVQTANAAVTQTVIAIQNVVSTEVFGTQTAEFSALITEIARQTEQAPTPQATDTPLPTATFTPVLIDTVFHVGDEFAVSSNVKLVRGRLYRICLSGIVNLTTGPAKPSDLESVNGVKVPLSGCVVLEGNGAVAAITCGSGVAAEDPGGFTVKVYDLGPY